MSNTLKIVLIGILALFLVVLGIYIGNNYLNKKTTETPDYVLDLKTQIHNLSTEFSKIKQDTFKYPVNPANISYYPKEVINQNLTFQVSDSLLRLIDSLNNQVKAEYNKRFLALYPTHPKFLMGTFLKDSLTLTLLNTEGLIYTKNYWVDYDKYSYQFMPDELKAKPRDNLQNSPISQKSKRENNFYLSLGHTEMKSSELISLDYQFICNRIKIETSANFLIYPKKDILLLGKVGYRLNKK